MQVKTKQKLFIFILSVLLLSILWILPVKNSKIAAADNDIPSSQWIIEDNKIISYLGQEQQVEIPDFYNGTEITEIGERAFADNSFLTSVQFPESVINIGARAFENCSNLAILHLPLALTNIGSYAFSNCVSLKEITIPGTLKNIGGVGGYVFNGCENLENVVLNEGVKEIGEYAFYQCKKLKNIEFPSTLEKIDTWAFGYCENLKTVVFPEGLKTIGSATFYYCNALDNIIIPNSVTEIGTHSFRGCWSLSDLTLSTSLKTIPYRAFSGCTALTNIELFGGLQSIGDEAFYNSGLRELVLPEGIERIGKEAFAYNSGLLNVTIPSTLKDLQDGAFINCGSLEEVAIADGLSAIGNNAFKNCEQLTKLLLPNTLISVGSNAFQNCINLYSICLPNSLTSIGESAFKDCYRLIEIFNLSSLEIVVGDLNNNGGIGAFVQCEHNSLENPSCVFIDEEGYVFYNGETKKLLGYEGEELELILPLSFLNDTYEIAAYAFYKETSIIAVQLPKNITKIGKYAFDSCTNLYNISYLGNQTEWAVIEIAEGNNCLGEVYFLGKNDEGGGTVDDDFIYTSDDESKFSFIDWLAKIGYSFFDTIEKHIFFVNFLLMLFWGIILLYGNPRVSNKTKKRNKLIFVLIACTQWVLISGLRADSVGDDTENYMLFFDKHGSLSWGAIFNGLKHYVVTGEMGGSWYMDLEPLFIVFNKFVSVFTRSHIAYKFIIAIIFMSSLGLYIYKYSEDPCLSFVLYGALFFNMFSLTGYRQVLATSICVLWGYQFIRKRKVIPFAILVIVSYFIHRSSIAIIPFYFFANKKLTKTYVSICVLLIICLFIFSHEVFNVMKVLMGYEEYAGGYGFKQITFFIVFFALTVVSAIQYKKIIQAETSAIQYYNGLILSWFIFPMVIEDPSALRLLYMFAFVLLSLLPLVVKSFDKTANDKLLIYFIVYAVFCLHRILSPVAYAFFWR